MATFCILYVQYPEYEDADVLAEGTIEDGEIKITVSNPEKIGDGMGAYMVYTVTVKVSGPITFVVALRMWYFVNLIRAAATHVCTGLSTYNLKCAYIYT